MSIDYRTLLVEQTPYGDDYPTADRILVTRIPDLPVEATFADLLRWGENVARTKERPDRESCVEFNGFLYGDTPDLLAALRTEADR